MPPKVIVVIPLYQATLKDDELRALANNLACLAEFPAVFLKPKGLDLTALLSQFPHVDEMEVSPNWLGTARGLAGYNEMMMSADFYNRFAHYDYLLICHVDAWVFRNELVEWMSKGYDHVAAPWPKRTPYRHFPLKQIRALRLWLKPRMKIIRWQRFGHIGNGGFSLRKVESFRRACLKYADEIAYFKAQENELYNEDLFWAFVPKELHVPTVEEALKFAFDVQPAFCYADADHRLPMACHGFNKPDRIGFWQQFIPEL